MVIVKRSSRRRLVVHASREGRGGAGEWLAARALCGRAWFLTGHYWKRWEQGGAAVEVGGPSHRQDALQLALLQGAEYLLPGWGRHVRRLPS